jgi:ATP-binding cassette, subfamily B, bacterial
MSNLKRFIKYYKPHKKLSILDLICAFGISGMDLLFPLFTREFINNFIPNQMVAHFFLK